MSTIETKRSFIELKWRWIGSLYRGQTFFLESENWRITTKTSTPSTKLLDCRKSALKMINTPVNINSNNRKEKELPQHKFRIESINQGKWANKWQNEMDSARLYWGWNKSIKQEQLLATRKQARDLSAGHQRQFCQYCSKWLKLICLK